MRAATLRWIGLALLGLLIAAAVSIAASRLASQQIGLASEPIEAGDALAPVARSHPHRPKRGEASNPLTTPTTATPPAATAPTPPATPAPSPTPEPEPSRSGGGEGDHSGGHSGGGGHADD
jgi:hypothetical protein